MLLPLHWCYPLLASTIEPPSDIAMAINLQLKGALEQLQWTSPTASAPVSQHGMPRRELPSPRETEHPLRPEGTESAIPVLMTTLMQMSLWLTTPDGILGFTHTTHPLLQLTIPKTLEAVSISFISQPQAPQGQISWTVRWATPATRENEHGSRAITCSQDHQVFPLQRAGAKSRTHSTP